MNQAAILIEIGTAMKKNQDLIENQKPEFCRDITARDRIKGTKTGTSPLVYGHFYFEKSSRILIR